MAEAVSGTKPGALFRLEFGGTSGWGHLVRSGVLAAELRRAGWTCTLWTGSDAHAVPRELIEPFDHVIPYVPGCDGLPAACAALVVDHYGTDDPTLRAWRAVFSGMILVIDDEGIRRLDAARLVLNARPGLAVSPYAPGVRCLLGERLDRKSVV